MFGSIVLEIFLGLALLFMTLSLVVTTAQELLAGLFGMRAGNLINALRNLLDKEDGTLSSDVLNHPVISQLFRGKARSGLSGFFGNGPSYLPSHDFAAALLDTLRKRNVSDAAPISMEDLFGKAPEIVREMNEGSLKNVLSLLVGNLNDAERSLQRRATTAERRLSQWYDEAMDRASGWYKRRAQALGLLLAAALTVAVDADALTFMQQLWTDTALRETLAEAAATGAVVPEGTPSASALLDQLGLFPLGWEPGESFADRFSEPAIAIRSLAGWGVTTLAVSLGAVFWFDLTKKALNLRASGPKPADGTKPGD